MNAHVFITAFSVRLGARPRRAAVLAAFAFGPLAGSPAYAAGPTGMPRPGHFQIDAETTITERAGPAALDLVPRIDGPTGGITVTRKSSGAPGNVAAQTFAGTGPNRWCVPPSGAMSPAKSAQNACQNALLAVTPAGSDLSADCAAGRVDEQWRRVADRTWERLLIVRQAQGASTAANSSPQAATELAMRGMTPAQRASAKAELAAMPSAADMADARGAWIAPLETRVHGADAEGAAVARQQFKALGAASGGSTGAVVRTKER